MKNLLTGRFYFAFCFAALLVALVFNTATAYALDWAQWRGPARDGLSAETGLLQEWPAGGPPLLWQVNDVGYGFSTPSVSGERLYLMSNEGDIEFARAYSVKDGKLVWSTRIGKVGNPDQNPNYPGARSTPTLDGKQLYALSSDGDLACLESASGKVIWQKNLRTDYRGKVGTWAYSESPLVDGDSLIVTPGGPEATMVALNKNTGETIWKSSIPEAGEANYSSIVKAPIGGITQYVQFMEKGVIGVDARTGKFLWRYDKTADMRYGGSVQTPVVRDNLVYSATTLVGGGLAQINGGPQDFAVEQKYFARKLPIAVGSPVLIGDYLYGTTNSALLCLDFKSGAIKWEDRSVGAGSLCYAENRLYLHGENNEVALIAATPESYQEKGRFTPPNPPECKAEVKRQNKRARLLPRSFFPYLLFRFYFERH
jgi:outer membrane protein assembly factor BamB